MEFNAVGWPFLVERRRGEDGSVLQQLVESVHLRSDFRDAWHLARRLSSNYGEVVVPNQALVLYVDE